MKNVNNFFYSLLMIHSLETTVHTLSIEIIYIIQRTKYIYIYKYLVIILIIELSLVLIFIINIIDKVKQINIRTVNKLSLRV